MPENNVENIQWQTLLEEVEKDLASLEAKVLELKGVRNYFRKRLGLPVEVTGEVPAVSETGVHPGILPKFQRGHFYGFKEAKAGFEVLQRAGRSLTTDEIFQVLVDSGYCSGDEDARRKLHLALSRSRRLVRVAPNTFDLAHRRPKARKPKEQKGDEEEKEKRVLPEQQTEAAPETGEEGGSD